MEIVILEPVGFCYGVKRSVDKVLSIIDEHKSSRIFLMGWLVHNKPIIDKLISLGVFILDDKIQSRMDIIDTLEYQEGDIIIFSAHGTDLRVIEKAKQKGFKIYDLTCPFVSKTHHLVNFKLNEGYDILFVGKPNHPETNAIIPINTNHIHLVSSIDDLNGLKIENNKLFCTNQTTLSLYYLQDIFDKLKNKYPSIEFENDICDETTKRQKAVIEMDDTYDICIIVGDKRSSNANELLKLASKKTDSYLITYGNEIASSWFENKKKCAIIGAASTSAELVHTIKQYIEEKVI